ncbi:MAG: SMP-30/gluconolactonase/LRE family protein [Acidimicrobiales bacterium]
MSTRILRDGIFFGEGPRWHEDRLWYSDFYDHAVHAIDLNGNDERVVEVESQPSGLGWLPNGDLIVTSMLDRKLLRWDGTSVSTHADLGEYFSWHANDLLVDQHGRSYVGNFGFDYEVFLDEHGIEGLFADPDSLTTVMCRVDTDGSVHIASDGMIFPNGMVITPDGKTMIVAETLALRLTAFDVAADGSLLNPRVWADLSPEMAAPDGICLDAEGAVWIATALTPRLLRVGEGGVILDEIATTMNTYACMLGGPEGKHLFAMTAPSSDSRVAPLERNGAIEVVEVAVPHAGQP